MPTQVEQKTHNTDFKNFKYLILKYKEKLQDIYISDFSDQQKKTLKLKVMNQMKQDYRKEKKEWTTPNAYDQWINSMNNAKMLVFGDYEDKIPLFEALFLSCAGDWQCFFQKSEEASLEETM